jgi:hypothetical protein
MNGGHYFRVIDSSARAYGAPGSVAKRKRRWNDYTFWMPLVYLDQNALIKLGVSARRSEFRKKLDAALASDLTIVMSSWHLVETAHTSNLQNAIELAEFIDSLNPSWLLERRDIQGLDVEEDFNRYIGLIYPNKPRVTTRSAAFASLNGEKDSTKFDIPSVRFVKQWIAHPDQLLVLEKTYKGSVDSLIRLREIVKAGKLTNEIRRRVDELIVKASLPTTTPAGLYVGRDVKIDYVQQFKVEAIPTLAIETAIAEHEWRAQGGADRNTMIDKMHLIAALPYVDEIVSGDKFFYAMYSVTSRTGHVRAKLLGNTEFLQRF